MEGFGLLALFSLCLCFPSFYLICTLFDIGADRGDIVAMKVTAMDIQTVGNIKENIICLLYK